MRLGTIDIGTNTILLLVADVSPDGTATPVLELQELPRLGKRVDRNRRLLPGAMERSIQIIEEFATRAREAGAERIIACGTSALRDAANREEFSKLLGTRTGLALKVLSGEEEAERTYLGAVSDIVPAGSLEPCCVLDVGGGSTEVVLGRGQTVESAKSIDIGAVRLTERFFQTLPATAKAVREAQSFVRREITATARTTTANKLIAVAGTPVTLASILLGRPRFDPIAVHGTMYSRDQLGNLMSSLETMPLGQIAKLPQVQAGREDVILAGTLILINAMDHFGVETMLVSNRGLRYGIALIDGLRNSGGMRLN
jgi:exopolyphosphatase/guanosine-5'-triphosphate,3'-diphosphate pyrophosphatase